MDQNMWNSVKLSQHLDTLMHLMKKSKYRLLPLSSLCTKFLANISAAATFACQ